MNDGLKREVFQAERKNNSKEAYKQATFVVTSADVKGGKDSVLSRQKNENSVAFPPNKEKNDNKSTSLPPGVTGETDPSKMSRIELLRSGYAKPGPFSASTGLTRVPDNVKHERSNSSETDKKKKVMFADATDDID